MRHRTLTGYVVGTALVLAMILAIRGRVATGVSRTQTEITETARLLKAEPDSVQSRVGYYRFRARRDTVAAMRAYLLKVVAAESAFVAESGHVASYVWVETTKGAGSTAWVHVESPFEPPFVWWAVVQNVDFRITCWVYVGPDTTMSHSASGKPACASDRAVPPGIIKPLRSPPR